MLRKSDSLFPFAAIPAFLGFLAAIGIAILLLGGSAKADNGLVTTCPNETMAWVLIHTWKYEPSNYYEAFEYFAYGSSAQRQSCSVMDSVVFDLSDGQIVGVKDINAAAGDHQFRRELVLLPIEVSGVTEFVLFER